MRRSSDDFKNNAVEVSKKLHFVAQTPRPRSDSTFLLLKKRRSGGGPEKLVKIKESAEISPENSSLPSSLVSGSHLSPLTSHLSPHTLHQQSSLRGITTSRIAAPPPRPMLLFRALRNPLRPLSRLLRQVARPSSHRLSWNAEVPYEVGFTTSVPTLTP